MAGFGNTVLYSFIHESAAVTKVAENLQPWWGGFLVWRCTTAKWMWQKHCSGYFFHMFKSFKQTLVCCAKKHCCFILRNVWKHNIIIYYYRYYYISWHYAQFTFFISSYFVALKFFVFWAVLSTFDFMVKIYHIVKIPTSQHKEKT